jgi:Phosphate-selective porin O and P
MACNVFRRWRSTANQSYSPMGCLKGLVILTSLAAIQISAAEEERVHFHGYAEVHSNNDLDQQRVLDVHRAVIGLKAQLASSIFFNMELDFEHAFTEPELEFAYVEWALTQNLSWRIGHMLMPMGPLNEFHEPPLFLSVERSQINTQLIPTTWNEVGTGFVFSYPEQGLSARAYLVNGLKGSGIIADKGTKGIAEGRAEGEAIHAEDIAGVARLEYAPILSLNLGASAYFGGADQTSDANQQLTVGLYSADAKFKKMGFQVQSQVAYGAISGSYFEKRLKSTGRSMFGYLGEVAYFFQDLEGSGSQLAPFVRFENINLDLNPAEIDAPNVGETGITAGVAFYPIPNLAFKLDVENWTSQNPEGYTAQSGVTGNQKTVINFGFGLMY